jgi:hypothetical protein
MYKTRRGEDFAAFYAQSIWMIVERGGGSQLLRGTCSVDIESFRLLTAVGFDR